MNDFMEKQDKIVEYLDVNGFVCVDEPSIVCAKHILNKTTNKERWYVSIADGILFNPKMSAVERSRAIFTEIECSREIYEDYKNFLEKRKEMAYNRVARMV